MPIAGIQFPGADLLEQTHRCDVLVRSDRVFPTIEHVSPDSETRPADVLAKQDRGLDGHAMIARREGYVLVIGAVNDSARAESQGWQPSAGRVGFVENLVT